MITINYILYNLCFTCYTLFIQHLVWKTNYYRPESNIFNIKPINLFEEVIQTQLISETTLKFEEFMIIVYLIILIFLLFYLFGINAILTAISRARLVISVFLVWMLATLIVLIPICMIVFLIFYSFFLLLLPKYEAIALLCLVVFTIFEETLSEKGRIYEAIRCVHKDLIRMHFKSMVFRAFWPNEWKRIKQIIVFGSIFWVAIVPLLISMWEFPTPYQFFLSQMNKFSDTYDMSSTIVECSIDLTENISLLIALNALAHEKGLRAAIDWKKWWGICIMMSIDAVAINLFVNILFMGGIGPIGWWYHYHFLGGTPLPLFVLLWFYYRREKKKEKEKD